MGLGYSVYVYDRNPSAIADFDASWRKGSGGEIAECCQVIITCVTDAEAVEDVLIGDRGVITRARTGQLIIDTTTSAPATTLYVASKLAPLGVDIIDAPVSRGVPAAEAGTMSIMAGGESKATRKAMPILRSIGTDIILTGELGTGHIAKAMNMMVLGVNLLVAVELMTLVPRDYDSRREALTSINESDGRSFVTENHFEKYVITDTPRSGFTLALMLKDIGIATSIGVDSDVSTPFGSRVKCIYELATKHGRKEADNMEIVRYIEGLSPIIPTSFPTPKEGFLSKVSKIMEFAGLLATVEAMLVGDKAGISNTELLRVINVSSGRSCASEKLENVLLASEDPARYGTPTDGTIVAAYNACAEIINATRFTYKPMLIGSLIMDFLAVARARGIDNTSYADMKTLLESVA